MKTPEEYAADRRRLRELLASYAPEVMPERDALEVSCGIGWYELLEAFLDEAAEAGRRTGARITVTQIKQKFGGLRISCHIGADGDGAASQAVQDAVRTAERASFTVCEACGAAGRLRSGVLALCEAHRRRRP